MHRSNIPPPHTASAWPQAVRRENSRPICQSDVNSCPGTWIGSPTWLECTCILGIYPKCGVDSPDWKYFGWLVGRGHQGRAQCRALNLPRCIQGDSWAAVPLMEIPGREDFSWLSSSRSSQPGLQVPVNSSSNTCADFIVSSREVRNYISGSDLFLHSWSNLKHLFLYFRLIR